jgi:hypothetical protein
MLRLKDQVQLFKPAYPNSKLLYRAQMLEAGSEIELGEETIMSFDHRDLTTASVLVGGTVIGYVMIGDVKPSR